MPETLTRPSAAELRDMLLERGDKLREMRERPAAQRTDTYQTELRVCVNEIAALDHEFTLTWQAEKFAAELRAFDDAVARAAATSGRGPSAATGDVGGAERRSMGAQFIESDAYKERRDSRTDEVEIRSAEFRTLLSTEKTDPAAGLWAPVGTPFLGNVRQNRLFIEDVIPGTATGLNSVPYIREVTPATFETGASSVNEGAAKPEVTMKFTNVDAPVRKVAAWLPLTSEIMDDAPTLMGYVDARLAYMVRLRREQQLLNGSGTAPQLTGLYNSSIATSSTGADKIIRIGVAIGVIEGVDGYPDAVAINPAEFWSIMTTRQSTFFDAGAANAGAPFGVAPTTLWGLPAIRTRSVAANKALVGDYGQGAQIFNKGGLAMKMTDSHDDYFIYNKSVVLAESRLALAVYRPDFFVDVTLS